ncbi:hypothetical protein SEUCBS139899_007211 [Sporothrix eucalyptigena]|uniref:Uncharacterized protein n=1 Tax=Sporothrix eucalyptigena TaxID=1812306 RepID=A0ABP0BRR3_9PEZI
MRTIRRGERAADKLERELHAFEAKLEELLSSMGMTEADLDAMEDDGSDEKDEGDEGGAAGMDSNATISKTDGTSSA